ncbi:MAG TPA: hypothetical protein VM121_00175 [Acidimicrobiales bacterium]|nr:hypothetical protein [Acidimicrobiales bacterium]
MRRIGFVLVLVALLAAACSSDDKKTTSSSGRTTVKVSVDNKAAFAASFLAYFPNEVKVHPGDAVQFASVFTGEPHTVTLGTLANDGLEAAEPQMQNPDFDPSSIPQLAAIPSMFADDPNADLNQSAAQPCFLATGNPPGPGETPCPKAVQPEFNGKQSVFSSGFLPNGEVFDVKLSKDIAPGTYRYFCEVHSIGMQGKITVVPAGDTVPTEAENKAAADAELQRTVSALQPGVDASKTAPPDKAEAGVVSEEAQEASGNVFGPATASIPVNGSVTWTFLGAHTISFNPPEDAKVFIAKAPDGAVHLNPKSFMPAGGGVEKPQPPGGEGPPGESSSTTSGPSTTTGATTTTGGAPPPPTEIDGGSYGGTGYYSTGVYDSFPPDLFSYTLKFTKAGTYSYVCLIHTGMEGTVKVG